MTTVTEEIPSGLLTLKLPIGYSLDRWVKEETERLKQEHPHILTASTELGPKYRRMHAVASQRRKNAETQYELLKLKIRERMGDAESATSQGIPFATRRIYPVPGEPAKWNCENCGSVFSKDGFWTDGYLMDAVFPV